MFPVNLPRLKHLLDPCVRTQIVPHLERYSDISPEFIAARLYVSIALARSIVTGFAQKHSDDRSTS
jgi:hypothetical protein